LPVKLSQPDSLTLDTRHDGLRPTPCLYILLPMRIGKHTSPDLVAQAYAAVRLAVLERPDHPHGVTAELLRSHGLTPAGWTRALAEGWLVTYSGRYLATLAGECALDDAARRPEIATQDADWRDEALTGITPDGQRSLLTRAVLPRPPAPHYRPDADLPDPGALREAAEGVVWEVVAAHPELDSTYAAVLLAACVTGEPVAGRGIRRCRRCQRWEIHRWHKPRSTWAHVCLTCEARAQLERTRAKRAKIDSGPDR